MVDIATLTGACVSRWAITSPASWATTTRLARELVQAGARANDRGWQLPFTEEYAEQLRSNFADIANVGGRDGGAMTAGAFLGPFTQGCAGRTWTSPARPGFGRAEGGTGRPCRCWRIS